MKDREPPRWLYFFAEGRADGGGDLKQLVGGKGAGLADMTRAGLNVPPGFTISTGCCAYYFREEKKWPPGLEQDIRAGVSRLEQLAGRPFGSGGDPLLVAVRSGAAESMPGMMDTVLNVGLNPDCVRAMAQRTGNRRGAWEAYRHFLDLFGRTVGGLDEAIFADLVSETLRNSGRQGEEELNAEEIESLCHRFLAAYREHTGTDLPADPWDMLRQAIDAVFNSWNNDRAIAYRRHHRIDGLLGTAVTVQMMCPAESSGVMFTANPVDPALEQILIESSFGLGEAVVLGKVTPDRFILDKKTLQIVDQRIGVKDHVVATLSGDGVGSRLPRDAASLGNGQVEELARLGLRVEEYFRRPCDIEWALSRGRFYLLQARAIKGAERAAERERLRHEEIALLKARAEPTGTVWSRYNLSEILPEPLPMTWAIVQRFMSGRGGFGLMYRDLGFRPDPALDDEGVYDLVCGRLYCNLSREPRMYAGRLPLEHSFAALKAAPHMALFPRAAPNWSRAGWKFWALMPLFLPLSMIGSVRLIVRVQRLGRTFARRFRDEIAPAFSRETAAETACDYSALESLELLDRLERWIRRTLFEFARDSLKPTALAQFAEDSVEKVLARSLGPERARSALGELTMGVRPAEDADLPRAIRELASGNLARAVFLERFGHRGSHEMELAQPRWHEDPAAVDRLITQSGCAVTAPAAPDVDFEKAWAKIAAEAKLGPTLRSALETELGNLREFLDLREMAKHHLMRGYALIRRVLVELDRRHDLDGGVFYLTPDELPRLLQKEDFFEVIGQRKRRRDLSLSLELPQVLFSDDLEAVGRPAVATAAESFQGIALSAGVAEAEALVLLEPSAGAPPAQPYVLVCPSTDPAWVPLFVNARALVMETGGVLSHGAIVAREFGLPAVAGIPDVHRRLRMGQRLRVDGGKGTVTVLKG